MPQTKKIQSIEDFRASLDDHRAMCLEAWTALAELASNPTSSLPARTPSGGLLSRNVTDCGVSFLSAGGGPEFERAVEIYRTSIEQTKRRNELAGLNHSIVANGLLVLFYHRWDEYHRPNIQSELGCIGSQRLQVDVFGDLKHLRDEIVHNKGISKKSASLKVLPSIPAGDIIYWHLDHWVATFAEIDKWLQTYST